MRPPLLLLLFSIIFITTATAQRRPRITGQNPVVTNEDQAVTITFEDLIVNEWGYPNGYTLALYPGDNYDFTDHTVTPDANFSGTLMVPLTINNGIRNSLVFNLRITVNPVNDAPRIAGQVALQTREDTPLTLQLANLQVTDPDNTYPTGFTMALSSGSNYTFSGNTITPTANFSGTLSVSVTVHDGTTVSNVFSVAITVIPVNDAPLITAQVGLTTKKNTPLAILLSHLTVTDADNTYPNGFSLSVLQGNNYTFSGTTVTPAQNFTGTLTVSVRVSDGIDFSAAFPLAISVTNVLEITGQMKLEVNEDERITLKPDDLQVNDPDNAWPEGFSLQILAGENYSAAQRIITPAQDFSGNLRVAVTVTNATKTSPPFLLTIAVKPVNDPPFISLEHEPLPYVISGEPMPISTTLEITDPDDPALLLAEVGFQPATYRSGVDELLFTNTARVTGIYNTTKGTLSLVGNASPAEYRDAIRSIRYRYNAIDNTKPGPKTLYLQVSDGKAVSSIYERQIKLKDEIDLDIPNVFTPDNNTANDTWKVTALKPDDRYGDTIIRVYDKRGVLVFETRGFENQWDGKYNGEVLPSDTYFYTIDMNLGSGQTRYKGVVTLLR